MIENGEGGSKLNPFIDNVVSTKEIEDRIVDLFEVYSRMLAWDE